MKDIRVSRRFLNPSEWRRECSEWLHTDALTWVYLFKALAASFLTLWLSYRLELPSPATAITTVFIVMQPQSGHVVAKSVYRFIGTIAGSSFVVLLMAFFPQDITLFIGGLALWVCFCSTGAAMLRSFKAYGFVLAGYTAVMVGLPVVHHPEQVFLAALWRVLEISLGILCASVVSATLLPVSTTSALRNSIRQRFGRFAKFVVAGLRPGTDAQVFDSVNIGFVSESVGLEALRSITTIGDPEMRRRNGRLNRLNVEFMALTTRFNALHQLLERRSQDDSHVLSLIESDFETLARLLEPLADHSVSEKDSAELAVKLESFRADLPGRIRHRRSVLLARRPCDEDLLDFNTAYELLYRFVGDLYSYALTHASLDIHNHEREQWSEPFVAKTNSLAALAAGLRSGAVLIVLSSFWIITTWPSGAAMTLVAALTVGLSAFSPNPKRMSFQIAVGTIGAAVIGLFEVFYVYPLIDSFALLCFVMSPVIMLGTYLLARPQWAGYGLGMLVFFGTGSIPANLTLYNPYSLINDYIAMVFGMLVCTAAGAVILPPNSPWLWRRLEEDLRSQILYAFREPLKGIGSSFDSRTRDLLHQAYGFASSNAQVQRSMLRWTFLVLDIGHAIIELRREEAVMPDLHCYAADQPWRIAVRAMGRSLVRLFVKPSAARLERSVAAVEHAISCVQQADKPFPAHFETSAVRRIESYLHFIRTSLLAPKSPFASYSSSGHLSGDLHVS